MAAGAMNLPHAAELYKKIKQACGRVLALGTA
jgi:hypothetical protein